MMMKRTVAMGSREGGAQPLLKKKFVRTLVMVDAPVLDKDRNNGGKSVGSNGGGSGGNSGGESVVCYRDQHPSEVETKVILMGHPGLSCHVPVVRSIFILLIPKYCFEIFVRFTLLRMLDLIRFDYHHATTGAYCVWAERGVNPFCQKTHWTLSRHPSRLCVLFSVKP